VLSGLFPKSIIRAEPDYVAAFYACPVGTDVCVIAGTGSLVCSRGANGIVKSGGRGYLLGDAGSAFNFGRDAMLYYLNHPKAASPVLSKAIQETFSTSEEREIIANLYRSGSPPALLAKLAKPLGQDATRGEEYAIETIERNVGSLIDVVVDHVARNLPGRQMIKVCLAGGLWNGPAVFRQTFEELLAKRLAPRPVEVTRIMRPPVHGAVELAKEIGIGN
jgi:N-acetylglucosamine kinase-like BadF-type ATPase